MATSGLVVEKAGQLHCDAYENDWARFYVGKKLVQPDWAYRLFPWRNIIGFQSFLTLAAMGDGRCEGMIAAQPRATSIKIAFLATAPWNYGPDKLRGGVGTGLMSTVLSMAGKRFPDGAILSSTPESESFYEGRGWTRTGETDAEDLAIFKLTKDRFDNFLAAFPHLPLKEDK